MEILYFILQLDLPLLLEIANFSTNRFTQSKGFTDEDVQSNFSGSNTFGTMKISSRQG